MSTRLLLGVLLLALCAGVWLAFAERGLPWRSADVLVQPAESFSPVLGQTRMTVGGLLVRQAERDGETLAVSALDQVSAADFPLVRYHVAGFNRIQELSLMWRRADDPDEVHAVMLPAPGRGGNWARLDKVEAWQGEIVEIGLASFPLAQQVPPDIGFRPWTLHSLELHGDSRIGRLRAQWDDWLAFQPWSLRSVAALGREFATRGVSLALYLGGLSLLIGLCFWLMQRGRGLSRYVPGLPTVFALTLFSGWLVLDLLWQRNLSLQLGVSAELFAGKSWEQRQRQQPDRRLLEDLDIARSLLMGLEPTTRIFVFSPSTYAARRAIFHLVPMNSGDLRHDRNPLRWRPYEAGEVLLFYEHPGWIYDPGAGRLEFSQHSLRVERIYQSERMGVFKVLDEAD